MATTSLTKRGVSARDSTAHHKTQPTTFSHRSHTLARVELSAASSEIISSNHHAILVHALCPQSAKSHRTHWFFFASSAFSLS